MYLQHVVEISFVFCRIFCHICYAYYWQYLNDIIIVIATCLDLLLTADSHYDKWFPICMPRKKYFLLINYISNEIGNALCVENMWKIVW